MLRTFSSDRQGAAIVEFTIVLPVLLLLGLGVFEFSNALYGYHVITSGLRDAARFLARQDFTEEAKANARQLAVYGEIGGTTKRLSWWDIGNVRVDQKTEPNPSDPVTGAPRYRGSNPLRIVVVSTDTSYPGLGLFSVIGLAPTLNISTFHEERYIGD